MHIPIQQQYFERMVKILSADRSLCVNLIRLTFGLVLTMAHISELHASDIPLLKSFVLEAWRLAGSSALGWTGATDENITEIASESFLRGLIGNPHLKVFISKIGEEVVGFVPFER